MVQDGIWGVARLRLLGLQVRTIGHVEIVEKISSNAYRLRLPSHVHTSDVFIVKHLIPYTGDSSNEDAGLIQGRIFSIPEEMMQTD